MKHITLLKELTSIKSYSGDEAQIRRFIEKWFKEKKINSFTRDGNLIVHFEGENQNKSFIFNSHMDTVSKGGVEWKYGPWTPKLEKNRLVGLGCSDMKSGVAASMLLAEQMSSNKPPVDMWFTYVTEEESDGSGTKKFATWFNKKGVAKKYKEIAGVFTEPTNLNEIEHGHKGNMFLKAVSKGDSGHASRPNDLRVHSVRKMIEFFDTLQKAFIKWQKEFATNEFDPPTLGEFTSIQAGVCITNKTIEVDSPNKFPSMCTATFDVRTTPAFHEAGFQKINQLAKRMGVEISYVYPAGPAGYTKPDEKIIRVAKSIVPKVRLSISKGSADLGFLSQIGVRAIIFGPGEKDQCHMLNEYCYPDQIPQAVEIYRQIVEAWAK